jgi:ApaG protein
MMEKHTERTRRAAPAPGYERTTEGIHVAVTPMFLEDESEPDAGKYLWAYTIRIENRGAETVQLISR